MTEVIHQQIWSLIQLRRYGLAKKEIADALAKTPGDADLFYLGAYVAWLESDEEYGLELSAQGLALAPDHLDLLYIRFRLLEDLKRYAEAEEIIIPLIRQNPRNADYLSNYARLMLFTFHVKKARLLCNEALRIEPDNTNAKVVDILLQVVAGKMADSERQLQSLLRDNPESERYLHLLLFLLITNKRFKPALMLAQELIRQNPHNQGLIETAIELRKHTHWSALPLWHVSRFGWPASLATWLGLIALLQIDRYIKLPWLGIFIWVYFAWVVYSWVHGPILGRWLKYRGIR